MSFLTHEKRIGNLFCAFTQEFKLQLHDKEETVRKRKYLILVL